MIFTYNKYNINISSNVLEKLHQFEQKSGKYENGGILLGFMANSELKILDATTPCFTDISCRFSFIRNSFGHQFKINELWKKSDGGINYIGEWHTHSEINPKPSKTDIRTLMKIRNYKNVKFPVVMIILGQKGTYWIGININGYIHKCKRYV